MIDSTRVIAAILSTPKEVAREPAARLVDAWVDRCVEEDARRFKVLDVERPFFMWLDDHTLIVGCNDLIAEDELGVFGGEWKTRRAPRVTKAGVFYKGDGPEAWLAEIRGGIQVAIYAAAIQAKYGGRGRILVRCVTKADVPEIWPVNPDDGQLTFTFAYLGAVRGTLRSRAAQIQAARQAGHLPWQWTGRHCKAGSEYECRAYGACSMLEYPADIGGLFSPTDPGAKAIAESGADLSDPELVILSASAYETGTDCLEKYRQTSMGALVEDSLALDVGTAFHAGIAEVYRMVKEGQNATIINGKETAF